MFFKWHTIALSMSVQARDSIKAFRRFVRELQDSAPSRHSAVCQDPVLALMAEATSPVFEIAGILQEERLIASEHGGYDIPRYIPLPRTREICGQIVALIMSVQIADEIATSPSILNSVAPWYDIMCRKELQLQVEPFRKSSAAFQRRRADTILSHLSIEETEKSHHCIGIVAGAPESESFGVFADHYRGPWIAERRYDRRQPYMHLIAEDSYRDLRWVSVADMADNAEYEPVIIPFDESTLRIARRTNKFMDRGQLMHLIMDVIQRSPWKDLYVLCGCRLRSTAASPVFWTTSTSLIQAVTGDVRPNHLPVSDIFRGYCLCEWAW
ncbi:hypothetical protein NEOLEDRAFT_403249 [Neolentinus lepideus HHB14362 ss-1]|uniref:Uncharacterized protein n=1 Tax=Neolentinus lepideus HHB14362 ss-1 TaxID=1314782 RepID=A0A165S3B6_9AGAM|nr:hypothetical protein NEOLEDRAFT_403249 [Neolentinus lepideus HHB14362 ss-1]